MTGDVWLFAVVAAPLLATVLAASGRTGPAFGSLALAALALAGAALAPGAQAHAPGLLLGVTLSSQPLFAPALLGAGAVWAAAALHASGSMRGDPRARGFAVLFGLAQSGGTLLLLADDLPAFYLGFSLMSLSAWGLVAHRRTEASRRAERVYLVFAVAGELCLFAAIGLIVAAAGGALPAPHVLGAAPPDLALWLALAAFGAKAGLVPLHVWLPLAHPAAPVPASAALSGAMLKAGLVGALKLAPPGVASAETLGETLLTLGFAGAVGAALYAALLRDLKTVLAWSSVSQLSLAMALLGAGLAGRAEAAAVGPALALFALHHGLAKGALFLGADGGLPRPLLLAAMAVAALALTGAPLTLGYAVKAAFEGALAAPWLAEAFALTGLSTALAMARALTLFPVAPVVEVQRGGATGALALLCLVGGGLTAATPAAAALAAPALLLAAVAGLRLFDRPAGIAAAR